MAARKLKATDVGLPGFKGKPAKSGSVFDLPSHARARDALAQGLEISAPGFNVFVLGPDRSGRMTETLAFIAEHLTSTEGPPPRDWVYLNNFPRRHRPKPYALPAGQGRKLRDAMAKLVAEARDALKNAFGSDAHRQKLASLEAEAKAGIDAEMAKITQRAQEQGLVLVQTEEGTAVAAAGPDGQPVALNRLPAETQAALTGPATEIVAALGDITHLAVEARVAHARRASEVDRQLGADTLSPLIQPLAAAFGGENARLARWFVELQEDMLDNLVAFAMVPGQPSPDGSPPPQPPEQRYAVNLLVDNGDDDGPPLVLESNPSYDRLVGRIEYRPSGPHMDTDFSLIRAGALHRANGGILVLRAESLLAEPGAWEALKAALRDGKVQIEERYRQNMLPVSSAPSPKPVPLSVKVVLVGAPQLYYSAFSLDPEFVAHFKIKADIDESMPIDARTIGIYRRLILNKVDALPGARGVDKSGVARLLGHAARWADDRKRLTARQELIDDVLAEANGLGDTSKPIDGDAIREAIERHRRRNSRIEDRMLERVVDGTVLIDTDGEAIGQINGLTVRDMGDHAYGSAARVTARASVGRQGVINIERQVAMGGPIQQKGAMVLQGYLAGLFARQRPMSFNCSITFEQSYGGVEGDSATLAEVLAVLSDLAEVPLRQDLAITGSMDQRGQAQVVGGVIQKIEGFFRACAEKGLTGTQGAVLPRANARNLVLDDDLTQAVADGRFHIHVVDTLADAILLFTGLKAGKMNTRGDYSTDTLYGHVQARLQEFDHLLAARAGGNTGENGG